MTQEEKELLLKDLSARLSYGVLCDYVYNIGHPQKLLSISPYEKYQIHLDSDEYVFGSGKAYSPSETSVDNIKPYLRPMSSMTEEEAAEFEILSDKLLMEADNTKIWNSVVDWLNAHHFDHRGLIPMGLALEATEGMYD